MQTLSLSQSLRFAWDVDRFLEDGRRLGDVWAFWWPVPLPRRTVVVGDQEAADVLLEGPTTFPEGRLLARVLGRTANLLDLPEAQPLEEFAEIDGEQVRDTMLAVFDAWIGGPLDLDPTNDPSEILTLAGVMVAHRLIGVEPTPLRCDHALQLLQCADTPALVCPPLRAASPRWWGLSGAREAWLRSIGASSEEEGDRAVLALFGMDAPVATAVAAALEVGGTPGARVAAAMRRTPAVPLLLRRLEKDLTVPGVGLLRRGSLAAVDAARARRPTGKGRHQCPGAGLGFMFAEAFVEVCDELGLRVRASGPRIRRRLVAVHPAEIVG